MRYKYAAAIRKSSESKEKQALSIKSQREEIKRKFSSIIQEGQTSLKPFSLIPCPDGMISTMSW